MKFLPTLAGLLLTAASATAQNLTIWREANYQGESHTFTTGGLYEYEYYFNSYRFEMDAGGYWGVELTGNSAHNQPDAIDVCGSEENPQTRFPFDLISIQGRDNMCDLD
ncbi:hypothetical protein BDW68DRAFT_182450 [Aspergillus falconensis]